jgi:outer membrane protein
VNARVQTLALGLLAVAAATRGAVAATAERLPAVLSLDAALALARKHQPDLRAAHFNTVAAEQRVDEQYSNLLPQLNLNSSYTRQTSNFAPAPSTSQVMNSAVKSSFDSFNYFRNSASASQLIWDFGQTIRKRDAAQASADATLDLEKASALTIDLNLRTAFFTASAARSAVDVARETLTNQNKHLEQIQAFVDLGRSPTIDVLQARVDQANAEVQLINAQGAYATARAVLNQAMGVEADIGYDVETTVSAPVPGESSASEGLVEEALNARPEIAALREQLRAQVLNNKSVYGHYWPSLQAQAQGTYNGYELDHLVWNLSAGLGLSWTLYDGGQTRATLREGDANVASLAAQIDSIRLQVRVDVEKARLAVVGAKASLDVADRSLTNARARLDLAEIRYRTGVGSIIELSDAQLAATNAAFQKLQAQLNLDTARAQLTKALAR